VAGLGDYGWTYEAAYRIGHGEVPYRDFISSLPPLTSYTLALPIRLFGDSFWWFQLHLYFWWFLALWVGWRLMRLVTTRPALLASAGVLAVAVSNPASTLGHAYNYAATTLAGSEMLLLMYSWTKRSRILCLAAGFAAAACVFAKQNVGVAMSFAGAMVLLVPAIRQGTSWLFVCFVLGWLCGFLPIAGYFSLMVGAPEFVLQAFRDAAAGKGGVWVVIGRALPRLILAPETPNRRLVETALSAVVLAILAVWGIRALRLRGRRTGPDVGVPKETRPSVWLVIWLAVAAILLLVSLIEVPALANLQGRPACAPYRQASAFSWPCPTWLRWCLSGCASGP
jgi:hypothetical protein